MRNRWRPERAENGFRFLRLLAHCLPLLAVSAQSPARISDLVDLSIEELTQVPITSVSRRPEPLATAASAIQIITGEEVRRSGATVLPEALRLAPNLQVKQITANDWAVTSRGFISLRTEAGTLANKLLVMIDGRPIYTPVFGGVYWETHNVLLDDINRIEIVSGPGGTLWGANAVNGVVNIIRRPASQTQGWYGNATFGAMIEDYSLRYGGRIGEHGHFRVYGQQLRRDPVAADGNDEWLIHQGGFRADLDLSPRDRLTVQGDLQSGYEGSAVELGINSHNLMAVWQHAQSEDSQWRLTAYTDRRWRALSTVDMKEEIHNVEVQHRYRTSAQTNIVWGGNYRAYRDRTATRTGEIRFVPESRRLPNLNAFIQGEFVLSPERLMLTAGTKFSDTEYSDFEFQPHLRLAWRPRGNEIAWAAVSRSVRTPTRIDRDVITPELKGNPEFRSETVLAYELGYRWQPSSRASLSLATYYNRYQHLRSFSANPDPPPPLIHANDFEVASWGAELFGMFAITDRWRLRAFYSYIDSDFTPTSPAVVSDPSSAEHRDSTYVLGLHSMMDLGKGFQLDVLVRRVGATGATVLPTDPGVAAHNNVDARLAWQNQHWEIALLGQNLNGAQTEINPYEIPRYVFLRTRFWY